MDKPPSKKYLIIAFLLLLALTRQNEMTYTASAQGLSQAEIDSVLNPVSYETTELQILNYAIIAPNTPNRVDIPETPQTGLVGASKGQLSGVVELARLKNKEIFGDKEWNALNELIMKESRWNTYAVNKITGACGVGQANPCKKMPCKLGEAECQIDWTLNYILVRYKTPSNALYFWKNEAPKFNGHNWY